MTFTLYDKTDANGFAVCSPDDRCWYVPLNFEGIYSAIEELTSVNSGWKKHLSIIGKPICTFTDWDDLTQQLTTNYPELLI